ncbi:Mblk-1-related factor 1 [Frankliniella fusca]|uniref:Mblk-1-related factor 1 n=1 Tax=Frankliniella fusca TaxID=407009 RepID=A0AAE1LMN4_9NEOP|nr:Mblk-1-related factor 1 [Frankliniella fusca]
MTHYKRKTEDGKYSAEDMRKAMKEVLSGKSSIRQSAKNNGLVYNTLNRKLTKLDGMQEVPKNMALTPFSDKSAVFPRVLEDELAGYVQERSELGFGMDKTEVRRLAYQLADWNN